MFLIIVPTLLDLGFFDSENFLDKRFAPVNRYNATGDLVSMNPGHSVGLFVLFLIIIYSKIMGTFGNKKFFSNFPLIKKTAHKKAQVAPCS